MFVPSHTPTGPTGEELSDHSESECALVQLIQLKAVNLVSALMSNAPLYDHAEDDQANRMQYLWIFWFDSLIPLVRSTRPSSDIVPIGDFLSQWEKRDSYPGNHSLRSGRKHLTWLLAISHMPNKQNKQGTEKQGRAGNRPSRGNSKSQSTRVCIDRNSKLHCHLSILVKEKKNCLLSHFVISLSSVNQSLYQNVDGETKTSIAKQILSAVLDQMEQYIVPYLTSGPSSDNSCDAKVSVDQCLHLCSCCIRFLLIMARSNEGIQMLRLQMRLELEEDKPSCWLRSSIGCMAAILDGMLSFAMQIEEMEDSNLKSAGFACALNSIVDQCIDFFKMLLLFVERQRESSSKSATFLVLTSKHHTILQSCCQRILAHQSPNKVSDPPCLLCFGKGLRSNVRYLFKELVINAEKGKWR